MRGPRQGPVLVAGGVWVVFDDDSRLRWAHSSARAWAFGGAWPSAAEQDEIEVHLARGGCLLVITDGADISAAAWSHEVAAGADPPEAEGLLDDLVEVTVEHFDWLPPELRERGARFLAEERSRWAREPAILRPAVVLDPSSDLRSPGQVVFAMTAPGCARAWIEREVVHYLEHVRADELTAVDP